MTDELQPLSPEEGVERFLEHHRPSVRDSSYSNAKHRLSVFLEWCEESGVDELNDLTGRDLADLVSWRQPQVAPITLQKQLSSVRQALRWWSDIEAVEEGIAEKLHAPELPDGAESKDVFLEPRHAKGALEYLDRHHYGSRDHAMISLLWRTGMRRSASRSIDVDDLEADSHAVRLEHRPDSDTVLKNGESGERWVYVGPQWFSILEAYRDNPDRPNVTDENGREPLFTTERETRPTGDTIYKWVIRALHPCNFSECPHGRSPDECEAIGHDGYPARCPSARSPHAVRRGAITYHLNQETTPEVVSERMDVSLDVLYTHYDARSEREKMEVRRGNLPQ